VPALATEGLVQPRLGCSGKVKSSHVHLILRFYVKE